MFQRIRRIALPLLLVLSLLIAGAAGCAPDSSKEPAAVRIATIQGPSGIGLAPLMEDSDTGETANDYTFVVEPSAQNIAAMVISGEVDMACVPTNLAATLYNKLEGDARLIALYTLGVLHVLENGTSVQSVEDLRGKTLHVSGQGSVPEYAVEFILDALDLKDDVTVEYYVDHDELAALAVAGDVDVCVLPEPKVTAALAQSENLRLALDVTELWADAAAATGNPDSVLAMGGIVMRADFLEEHPDAVELFLSEYEESISFVLDNPEDAGQLVEKHGIMPKAAIATKAIPNCNIVYIDGQEMKDAIRSMYDVLFEFNPQSIGGAIPEDDFYYIG